MNSEKLRGNISEKLSSKKKLEAPFSRKIAKIVIGWLVKYKMDLSKEFLTPLINALAFLAQAASPTNQFRRNIIKPKLPGWMKQLAKNVTNGRELLFGDDLNKRVKQINNTNNALLTKPIHTVSYKLAANQTGEYSNGKSTTINIKTAINIQKSCIVLVKLCY